MSFSHRRSLRLSRSTIHGEENLYPFVPPNSFYLEEEDDVSEKLPELLKTAWKLYTVSPLFNLTRDEASLKRCITLIQQELLDSKNNVNYKVLFESDPDLTASENDEEALKIRIISKKKHKVSVFYEGVFLSWRNSAVQRSQNQTFINLPLLLCNGSVSNISKVHCILSRLFDCVFAKFVFTQYDFKWLSCIALKCSPPSTSYINFIYCLPGSKNGSVNHRSSFQSLKLLWQTITEEDRITFSDVNKFYGALQEHFLNTFNIDLNRFIFKNITVSKSMMINNAGKLRIHSAQVMDLLLKYCSSTCVSRRLIDKRQSASALGENSTV